LRDLSCPFGDFQLFLDHQFSLSPLVGESQDHQFFPPPCVGWVSGNNFSFPPGRGWSVCHLFPPPWWGRVRVGGIKEGQAASGAASRIGKRMIGPPSRWDLSRFLLEKNSDAAPAGGSDRGEIPSKWTGTTDRFGGINPTVVAVRSGGCGILRQLFLQERRNRSPRSGFSAGSASPLP
jgi:hypothetical protein